MISSIDFIHKSYIILSCLEYIIAFILRDISINNYRDSIKDIISYHLFKLVRICYLSNLLNFYKLDSIIIPIIFMFILEIIITFYEVYKIV